MSSATEEAEWMREKRALEERIRQLELLQQQHPPQPPPPTSVNSALHSARMPTEEETTAMYERLNAAVPESSTGANTVFFGHLTTIVGNLLLFPYTDPKYRRLKLSNKTLSSELLNHPSATTVLQNVIGFAPQMIDGERFLVVPPSDPVHITTLRSVKGALARLTQRDDIATEAAKRFAAFRKSVAFEVRMERLQQVCATSTPHDDDDGAAAMAPQKIDEYIVSALSWNDTDTGRKVLSLLRVIIENILRDPANQRFRSLPLTSNTVRDTVLPAQGSVELLIAVLGFEWTNDGLALPPSVGCAPFEAAAQRGYRLLDAASKALEAKRAAENEMRRAAALAEREAEKKALQASVPQPTVATPSVDAAPAATGAAPSKRIPIADALKILMGKQRGDEDW